MKKIKIEEKITGNELLNEIQRALDYWLSLPAEYPRGGRPDRLDELIRERSGWDMIRFYSAHGDGKRSEITITTKSDQEFTLRSCHLVERLA